MTQLSRSRWRTYKCIDVRLMLQQLWQSVLCQTLHVHVTSDTQKIMIMIGPNGIVRFDIT